MKWFVYNLVFALAFPFMLPGFFCRMIRRGGYRARMGDRFAIYPAAIREKLIAGDFVWVHAVSVGEVQVAGQLMREWRKRDPSVRFCFSTTSSTGWKMAERETGEGDVLIYNPLDFPNFVKSALKTIRPRAIVLTESEIWPVFIRKAKAMGIPLFLINARVSDRSAPRYAKARFFFKDVFRCFSRIFAQSELDKSRLLAAGAPEEIVEVTGSFKFDVARRNPAKEAELCAWLGNDSRPVLLGGSTWPGEDEALLRIYRRLLETKEMLLVLAPRHFEKADAVEANIRAAGFDCIRRSRNESAANPGANDPSRAVYLADTTGELMGLYGIATVVFVGKSLCEHGSQNMIEPCLCAKPTIVGPYTENFRPVMSDLQEGCGILQVPDEEALEKTILDLFANGDCGLGERARRAVERRLGVVPTCVESIVGSIAPRRPETSGRFRFLRTLGLSLLTLVLFASLLAVVPQFAFLGRAKTPVGKTEPVIPKFKAIRTAGAYISMIEQPFATYVYLADAEAERYEPLFRSAGLLCDNARSAATNRLYDIVFCGELPSRLDWSALCARLRAKGVLACAVDVKAMPAARFREILESFPVAEAHFWMPGDVDWLLTGRVHPSSLKMSAVLDFFSQSDKVMTAEAIEAGCDSLQGIFASYVGTRSEILPAFASGDLSAVVRPEFFISREIPDIDWIVPDGLDADIVAELAKGVRERLLIRRRIVEGNYLSGQGKVDEAIAAWSEANVSNPHDTMLMERLYRLAVNARAFAQFGRHSDAAQCYDVLFAVRPEDLAVAEEYKRLLMNLPGRLEDAVKIGKFIKERKAIKEEK